MVALLALSVGCAGKTPAVVIGTPTAAEVQTVRVAAVQAAEGVKTSIVVLGQAAKLLDTLPVSPAVKNGLDCAIVKALGTTSGPSATVRAVCGAVPEGPGPVVVGLDKLKAVTSNPSLKTTLLEILSSIDPVIAQLEGSSNPALATFATILRASLAFSRTLLGGA